MHGVSVNREERTLPKPFYRALQVVLVGVAGILLALHYVHLRADFPNHSPWMDWSKYTDEGWYGDAAIRYFQLGHWYVRGAFNPAVALPVWPLLEAAVFRLTGVSLVAARALSVTVFAATVIAVWFLVRGCGKKAGDVDAAGRPGWRTELAAAAAVLMLAASPFCFVFTRLAILEPLLVFLMTLALLTAAHLRQTSASGWKELQSNATWIVLLGLLIPAMILTKTTAIFLLPALGWMMLASLDYKLLSSLRIGSAIAILAGGIWILYYVGFVRPHYLEDYLYLFSANTYTFLTLDQFPSVVKNMLQGGWWLGSALYLSFAASVMLLVASVRWLRARPLLPALVLWIAGYASFLVYHNNLQPRYYYVLAVPITLLVPAAFSELLLPRVHTRSRIAAVSIVAVLVLFAIVVPDAKQTVGYVRNPQYTLVNAAAHIHDTIAAAERVDPAHPSLVLSISGSDLSLMTGLPSICDDFSTMDLDDEVKLYKPGWYVAWNQMEDDKMDALYPEFKVRRVATFPAMDDPERNLLVLYRIDPAELKPATRKRRKRSAGQLHTPIGQQPSTSQLKH